MISLGVIIRGDLLGEKGGEKRGKREKGGKSGTWFGGGRWTFFFRARVILILNINININIKYQHQILNINIK